MTVRHSMTPIDRDALNEAVTVARIALLARQPHTYDVYREACNTICDAVMRYSAPIDYLDSYLPDILRWARDIDDVFAAATLISNYAADYRCYPSTLALAWHRTSVGFDEELP